MELIESKEDIVAHFSSHRIDSWGGMVRMYVTTDQVSIEIGERDWPERNFAADAWERVSFPLVFDLIHQVRASNNFRLRYDKEQDFQCIDFTVDGHPYMVRWYKVFVLVDLAVRSNGETGLVRHFGGNSHRIPSFFVNGHHKEAKEWTKP